MYTDASFARHGPPLTAHRVGGDRYLQDVNPTAWHAAEWGAFGQVGALVVAIVAGLLVRLQAHHGRQVPGSARRADSQATASSCASKVTGAR